MNQTSDGQKNEIATKSMRTVRLSASWAKLFTIVVLSLPRTCFAYVTWGDFHVFAVIFFSFLGGFLALSAIFGAIYFACGKNFFSRHQQQVIQTHREHHPWPSSSARWHLQQMIKSERCTGTSVDSGGQTRFPIQKSYGQLSRSDVACPPGDPAAAYYPDLLSSKAPASLYQRTLDYCGAGGAQNRQPIIGATPMTADYCAQQPAYAASIKRPTYFTPSTEKHLIPIQEKFGEYREESFVSLDGQSGSTGERTSQRQHCRHSQQPQTAATTIAHTSRHHSPQTTSHSPNTYI